MIWIGAVYSISGFCALIYQICWQRALSNYFGIHIESVTLIISIFMFGLGGGALLGGFLAKRFSKRIPELFLGCEILIGLFGFASFSLIESASHLSGGASFFTEAILLYSLLAFPTLLMGATLPLLVSYFDDRLHDTKKSVAWLYFINTLGGAVACFVVVDFLFPAQGLHGTVKVAATLNVLIGLTVYAQTRVAKSQINTNNEPASSPETKNSIEGIKWAGFFLAFFSGYFGLSLEMLWFRAATFILSDTAIVFGYVLGTYLAGLALGAFCAPWIPRWFRLNLPSSIALLFCLAGLMFFVALPFIGRLLVLNPSIGKVTLYGSIALGAALNGTILPLVSHWGPQSTSSGRSFSWIYFSNIMGCTAGPLVTGFVVLEWLPLENAVVLFSSAMIVTGTLTVVFHRHMIFRKTLIKFLCGIVIILITALAVWNPLYGQLLERLQYRTSFDENDHFRHIVQNPHGIITVSNHHPNKLFGGGVYDGRFTTDPISNLNGIRRAFMVASFHPEPKEVLSIGLGSGSWIKVLSSHEAMKRITVAELNPGYMEIIRKYDDHASILSDPRIEIMIKDGRKWLLENPERKFDLILMNTTFHWRTHASRLLSVEFLTLLASRLNENGIIYYNSTRSNLVASTACEVFPYVSRYKNFIAASFHPFSMTQEQRRANLLRFRKNGSAWLDPSNPRMKKVLTELEGRNLPQLSTTAMSDLRIITDDNMATEFKSR